MSPEKSQKIIAYTLIGARTVADCFRMRNKIGLDVAMEALRETRRSRKVTRDQILQMARDLRVERVILPYMEMEAGA